MDFSSPVTTDSDCPKEALLAHLHAALAVLDGSAGTAASSAAVFTVMVLLSS